MLESAPKDSEKDEEESSGPGDEVKKSDSDAANIVEDALQLKLDEDLNEYRDVRSDTRAPNQYKRVYSSIQDQDIEEELNHEADDQDDEEVKGKISTNL